MGLLDFEWTNLDLSDALEELPETARKAIAETIDDTTERAIKIVKFKTPVDSGRAISGWEKSTEDGGLKGVFSNDTPYINVLEFGGYPVRSAASGQGGFRRGNAVLGGLPPGPRTQRAPGGDPEMRDNVSKQAPRGMVRATLQEIEPQFVFDLNEALDEALNEAA